MQSSDRTLKALLMVIALFLAMIAIRPFFYPATDVLAQSARFDHVQLIATTFLYKGQQGLLVLDRRNANVWFIPRTQDQFQAPVFVIRLPFEKLDQSPQ
jgi:hypothetical protein